MNIEEKVQVLLEGAVLQAGSLVWYRGKAALVQALKPEKSYMKVQLQTEDHKKILVRYKDFWVLASGPVTQWKTITEPLSLEELPEAWRLLQETGQRSCSLGDIAELTFGSQTPQAIYQACLLINQTPYFKGRCDQITVRTADEVEKELAARARHEQEEKRWKSFLEHWQSQTFGDEDQPFLAEIEELAYSQRANCRLFRELKLDQTPENAHRQLLGSGIWPQRHNPYLKRFGILETEPDLPPYWPEFLRDFPRRAEAGISALESFFTNFCKQHGRPFGISPRRDLSSMEAWAIDDPWTQDPDDAVSITPDNTIWVHIADPASLIPQKSQENIEAGERGATVYLPEGNIPMLPRPLIGVLGLGLHPLSPALSIHIALTGNGPSTVTVLEVVPSWVRVKRLSYDQTDQILRDPQSDLYRLQKLTLQHTQKRLQNRAVQFDMGNIKIAAAEKIDIQILPNTPSRDLVAETMIMAGAGIAEFARGRNIAIPYLRQSPPNPIDEKYNNAGGYAKIFALRKSILPSSLGIKPDQHACIGLPLYTRCTSPLRRYTDLLVQQQLHAFLSEPAGCLNEDALLIKIGQAETALSRVNAVQRNSKQHWQMLYLQQEGKRPYRAVVLDVADHKSFCLLPEIGLETWIPTKVPPRLNAELKAVLRHISLEERKTGFTITA